VHVSKNRITIVALMILEIRFLYKSLSSYYRSCKWIISEPPSDNGLHIFVLGGTLKLRQTNAPKKSKTYAIILTLLSFELAESHFRFESALTKVNPLVIYLEKKNSFLIPAESPAPLYFTYLTIIHEGKLLQDNYSFMVPIRIFRLKPQNKPEIQFFAGLPQIL
jgi:hypothetical protein